MTNAPAPTPAPPPEFHDESGTLRFWVLAPDRAWVGASLAKSVLHYRFNGKFDGSDAVTVYAAHRPVLEAAVLKRVAAGSREPVMLREHDLPLPPR
ncbi:MAG: hypothetical protein KGL18_11160 [Burkholderiales bacterium]|nr:hypothetical protein [Burkholderiales bacterium]MDE1926547.1 hypothetical protein [Burkholderiales bacterium]MDE2160157.1 hypothetical protein [Burkholderiales bacterium]MDE2503513.1 hypothetical protein [Burkholderiales bacterium]